MSSDRPLWVQSDRTILLEVGHALAGEAQAFLPRFAELEKSPERFHTYRITPLSLWNAAAVGVTAAQVVDFLQRMSREPPSQNVLHDIEDFLRRYGLLRLVRRAAGLVLESGDAKLLADFVAAGVLAKWTLATEQDGALRLDELSRGEVKQTLLKLGYPVDDVAGYTPGAPYRFELRTTTLSGKPFTVRPYQRHAAELFHAGGSERGGSGVIVLPCGAGKTVVSMAVIEKLQCETLVLTTNTVAVRQWKSELIDKANVPAEDVGEYTGDRKEIRPITISTYQILTHRKEKGATPFTHFGLFAAKDWGLIVYDEVHLLPAPVFRASADLQARRRLGLTATLVREDHREDDVFSLIGPKRFDMPWKELETLGWIAEAHCIEVRVPLPQEQRIQYLSLQSRDQFRLASENPDKLPVLRRILAKHGGDHVLVIGQYLEQIEAMAKAIDAPLIVGKTPTAERERLYRAFKEGRIPVLVVSKVGNFAIDLPDANVAVQVSGTFGSRQEEAQRLGRILRPKSSGAPATFYSLVSKDTKEEECAERRQRYLTERGYTYRIASQAELP
ncbi:MAG: DEAD/DEAH box helicase [Planctomycetes bacterium]|nr:DEAD/DEAH box helicase [Planctomycetota bacterium]